MTDARQIAVVRDYVGLIAGIRARIVQLGLTYETVDALAGFTTRYTSRVLIEEPQRNTHLQRHAYRTMGLMSLGAMLGATGLKIALIEDVDAMERIQHHRDFGQRKRPMHRDAVHAHIVHRITSEFMRQIGHKGGKASRKSISKKQRRVLAKRAAKARWSKPTLTEITRRDHPA